MPDVSRITAMRDLPRNSNMVDECSILGSRLRQIGPLVSPADGLSLIVFSSYFEES